MSIVANTFLFEFAFNSCVCSHRGGLLGVCSIMVDCFVSSISHAVAIGIYAENFTEKPDKDAVNIQIRFTLLPYWTRSSNHRHRNIIMYLLSKRVGLTGQSSRVARSGQTTKIVYMFGRRTRF